MSGSQDEIPPPTTTPPSSSQTPTQQTPHTTIQSRRLYKMGMVLYQSLQIHKDKLRFAFITAEEIMTDAKEMWDAIKSRFGGNDESKKMQKYILKQQFEGFSVSNSEGLHKGYDRFQSLLSQLEIHGAGSTASSSSSQNVAFVSENTNSTNDVSTAYSVSNTSGQNPHLMNMDLEEMDFEVASGHDLNENELCYKKIVGKLQIKGNQDNRRRDAWNSGNKDGSRTGKKEDSKALVTIDGEGVDWTSHSEEDEDYALMACNSSESDTEVTSCSNECKESYAKLKKLYDVQREQLSDASIEIKAYTQGLKKVEAQLVAHQQGQLWYEQKIKFMKIDLDDKTDVLTYHKKLLAEAQKEKEDLKAKVEKWHNSSKNLGKLLNTQMSANDKFGLGYGDHRYDGILSYENEVLQSVFMNKESELEKQPLYDRFVTAGGMHAVPPPMTGNYMPSGPDIEVDYSQFTYGPKQTQPSESETQTSEFDTCESNISIEPSELVSEPVVNESNVECQPKVWSDAPIIEEYESDSEYEYVSIPTKEHETPSFANQQVKTPRETVKNQFTHSKNPKVDKKELGYGFTARACFVCGSLNHLIRDCDFHEKRMAKKAELNTGLNRNSTQREKRPIWNNVHRINKQNQFVPTAVLTRTGKLLVHTARASGTKNVSTARHNFNRQAVLTSTAKKVNTVKPIVNRVRPANVFHKTHSPSSRPFNKTTVLRTNFSKQKVNTAKVNAVSAVGGKRETAVKPSAGCNWRPQRYNWHNDYPHRALKNKGIVDSGCSRHMTGNKAYLAEFQDFNGGPVAFGGSKGYITGKGKIKTGKLDFEDVCFVKELQHFNLFSVSQMCDKKNKVLFTDSECLVLSPEFKLPDENQVLLKIPRQNNMYSFNLENIVPSGGLACLIAKATIDESNKWHRRLGHVNFKNLNKLVKENCEFKNRDFIEFCGSKGIQKGIRMPETPQQNGVAERKNRTLIEAARTMLADSFLPNTFWAEAVSTACYVLNRVLVTKPHNKTPYELVTGKIPIISYIRPFGCHVTILNTIDHLGKFDGKSDEGFLVGYSLQSKAFRVYNLETKRVEENLHITFLENKPNVAGKGPTWLFDLDYLTDSMNYQPVRSENRVNKHAGPPEANQNAGTEDIIDAGDSEKEDESAQDYFVLPIWSSYSSTIKRSRAEDAGVAPHKHPDLKTDEKPVDKEDQVFLDELERLKRQEKDANDAAEALRKEFAQETENLLIQVGAAKASSTNINTMHFEDIYQNPTDRIFTNSSYDDEGAVADFTNLEYVVNVDAMQEELMQFKIQKVWILVDLPYGKKAIGTKCVYRNKKDERGVVVRNKASTFLYGKIDREVYVSQPPGFIDPKYPQKVYKVVKALYGLHQAPRAWYATLSTFLLQHGYRRGTIDKTLFIKKDKHDIILDKYVAEIRKKFDFVNVKTASTPIETQKPLVKDEEASDVDVYLYRSMIGSLMYLTASRPDIMFAVCACSRFQVTPKTSHLSAVKRIFRYLKGKPKLGLWYPRVSSFDLEAYSDSDYAGANLDRKSTTGGCQFLGRRLISWQCKKQTIVATSTTEAEYVAAANCCGQVLWIQNQMLDYGFNFMNTKIYIDNESTICIVKNPVYHSKTKHIAIRHHFIRDAYEKKLIQVLKIHTDDNVADLLTKAFDVSSSLGFRESLGRALDGTEALMLPKLFILWLATVSTDSAELVPMGKVSTAIETLKKNTAKALISLSPTITHSKIMAVLESCPKHNMVAYLEKTEGNAEFHEIIDFLTRSSIHHALTVSPVVSTTFVEQFWTSAKSKIINNVRHITAKVAGKPVSISEASIRSDLLFNDADGIDSLPNQAIFDAIQLMGYEGDLTVLTFNKALFSPQWRVMSSSTHPITILYDSNVEDAFSSTDTLPILGLRLILSSPAYNATNNESLIPLPQAPIAPPTILPPSPCHEEHIETILNHIDELPLESIEHIEDKIKGPWKWTSTLEILIEDIQIRHRSDMKSLLYKIHELKNHKGGPLDYSD
ncbi:putative ribonuclease H-like domain-containing protein [Tanacetum coccineum]